MGVLDALKRWMPQDEDEQNPVGPSTPNTADYAPWNAVSEFTEDNTPATGGSAAPSHSAPNTTSVSDYNDGNENESTGSSSASATPDKGQVPFADASHTDSSSGNWTSKILPLLLRVGLPALTGAALGGKNPYIGHGAGLLAGLTEGVGGIGQEKEEASKLQNAKDIATAKAQQEADQYSQNEKDKAENRAIGWAGVGVRRAGLENQTAPVMSTTDPTETIGRASGYKELPETDEGFQVAKQALIGNKNTQSGYIHSVRDSDGKVTGQQPNKEQIIAALKNYNAAIRAKIKPRGSAWQIGASPMGK